MLDLVVNLIDKTVPIMKVPQALILKVGRLGNGLQKHGIQVEGIFRTMKRNKPLGSIVLYNGERETQCEENMSHKSQ
jgi:hypothetical protein